MSAKELLKKTVPWSVRRYRYVFSWKSISQNWRALRNDIAGPAPLKNFDDYNDYWSKRKEAQEPLRRWVMAAQLIPDGCSVLDFGCGSGDFLKYLRTIRPKISGKGMDLSHKAVEMTREHGFQAETFDVLTQEINDQFDYVTSFEVLEHIGEADLALRKLKKCFRKRLIISIPNVGSLNCRLRLAIFGRFPLTRCLMHVKEHLRHWTPKDFREWVSTENLRVVEQYGDWGIPGTPWKLFPALFARGMVYVVEHAE